MYIEQNEYEIPIKIYNTKTYEYKTIIFQNLSLDINNYSMYDENNDIIYIVYNNIMFDNFLNFLYYPIFTEELIYHYFYKNNYIVTIQLECECFLNEYFSYDSDDSQLVEKFNNNHLTNKICKIKIPFNEIVLNDYNEIDIWKTSSICKLNNINNHIESSYDDNGNKIFNCYYNKIVNAYFFNKYYYLYYNTLHEFIDSITIKYIDW